MSIELKNAKIRLVMGEPGVEYTGTRFDWCGQILEIHYRELFQLCGRERKGPPQASEELGIGLHNELGTEGALAFEECPLGEYFFKIGLGLMKKDYRGAFDYYRIHSIKPLPVELKREDDALHFSQQSPLLYGYAYFYQKTIRLKEEGFQIDYYLENRGTKSIDTSEYVHNFLSFNREPTGPGYRLLLPVDPDISTCHRIQNPGSCVSLQGASFLWSCRPKGDFYFGGLNAGAPPDRWTLQHQDLGISLEERCLFPVSQMKLWGNGHAISPELFKSIHLEPGEGEQWSRLYRIVQNSYSFR